MKDGDTERAVRHKAGVVVYRENDKGETEVLLVSSRKYEGSWVFPVGTVEGHETLQVTAARECEEESGYIVEVEDEVGIVKKETDKSLILFTFYKARVIDRNMEYEQDREIKWVILDDLKDDLAEIFVPVALNFEKSLI